MHSPFLTRAMATLFGVQLSLFAHGELSQKQLHQEVLGNARANVDFGQGNYAAARLLWLQLAEMGNAHAMYSLGALYRDGLGVTKDPALAFFWLEQAGNQGEPNALYDLCDAWRHGLGTRVSAAKASEYELRAAFAGIPDAQLRVGEAALAAGHVEQAWYWLTEADRRHSKSAATALEQLYQTGFTPPAPAFSTRERIRRFLEEMDSALNARDTEILRLLLANETVIHMTEPTSGALQSIDVDEFMVLLRQSLQQVDRFRTHRGSVTVTQSGQGIAVASRLHQYLVSAGDARKVEFRETLALEDTPNGLRIIGLTWYTEQHTAPVLTP